MFGESVVSDLYSVPPSRNVTKAPLVSLSITLQMQRNEGGEIGLN